MTFHRIAAVVAATLAAATPAAAQTYFDFRTANSSEVGAAGNTRDFRSADGTMVVTVAAWSLTSVNATPEKAYLGTYGNGLGVTNRTSWSATGGWTTTDDSHTIDNSGMFDYVSLSFKSATTGAPVYVQLRHGILNPYNVGGGAIDNDPSVSFTDIPVAGGDILNDRIQKNLQLHTTELQGNLNAKQGFVTDLNPGMNTGYIWTVGANRLFDLYKGENDGFKLAGVSVELPVPEPATWAMMIVGFGVVGGSLRRRRPAGSPLPA